MKKKYSAAELEFLRYEAEDILTQSYGPDDMPEIDIPDDEPQDPNNPTQGG